MKTISNPSELQWTDAPVPSASLCSPESRIVIFEVSPRGWSAEAKTLKPESNSGNSWRTLEWGTFVPAGWQSPGFFWAWYRRF